MNKNSSVPYNSGKSFTFVIVQRNKNKKNERARILKSSDIKQAQCLNAKRIEKKIEEWSGHIDMDWDSLS